MWPRLSGRLTGLAILASPFITVAPAYAQQSSPEQIETIRQACRSDFVMHCSGVQPGGREALQCLQRNAAQLSPACGGAVGAISANPEPPRPASAEAQPATPPTQQDQLAAIRRACTLDDFLAHCSWIQPTSPEVALCLRHNVAWVSPGCQTALGAIPAATPAPIAAPATAAAPAAPEAAPARPLRQRDGMAVIRACVLDIRTLCADMLPAGGGGVIFECLARNASQLRPQCRAALAEAEAGAPR